MSAVALNGAFVGLVYGLLGVGLVMTYRGSRTISFAYGETGMIAAFLFTELRFGSDPVGLVRDRGLWPALPMAVVVAAALGVLTEVLVVRPLRNAPRIRPLVGTFAVGTLFFVFASRRWGLSARSSESLIEGDGVVFAGLRIQPAQLLILGVSVAVLVALFLVYRFTPFGLRLRAAALDPYAAGLVGIDVNLTSMIAWALAGALAGVSAILIAPLVAVNTSFMTTLSIRGLAAALVGGLTNISGAFTAGILIGVAEAIVAFKSPLPGVADITIAGFILTMMVARPSGLFRAAY